MYWLDKAARMLAVLLIAFLLSITCIYLYIVGGMVAVGTDVAFQSSDGNWARSEAQFEEFDFALVVYDFELYRMLCDAPGAKLHRTTPRPGALNLRGWFNDYREMKWRVPLNAGSVDLPGFRQPSCMNGDLSAEQRRLAQKKAEAYFAELAQMAESAAGG